MATWQRDRDLDRDGVRPPTGAVGRVTTTAPKTFVCQRSGCNKRFTRDEHLQRHALNHTEGEHTCPRCRAHFKRPDLLNRHLQRHKQRDDEVGADGYGVLNTRKRAWKSLDGTLVQKRPSLTQEVAAVPTTTTPVTPPDNNNNNNNNNTALVHYAGSSSSSGALYADAPLSPTHTASTHSDHSYPSDPSRQRSIDSGGESEAGAINAAYHPQFSQTQFSQLSQGSGSLDSLASLASLAALAPFSTEPGLSGVPTSRGGFDGLDSLNHFDNLDNFDNLDRFSGTGGIGGLEGVDKAAAPGNGPTLDFPCDDVFQADTASSFNMPYTTAGNYNWLFSMDDSSAMDVADVGMDILQGQAQRPVPFQGHEQGLQQQPTPPQTFPTQKTQSMATVNTVKTSTQQSPRQPQPASHNSAERPLAYLRPPTRLPIIDRDTHVALLDAIDACNPNIPSGQYTIWDHPLLALSSLQTFCDLYFLRFNTAYPLLHPATFNPRTTEPLLLLSVLLLGATYSGKDAHQLAVCIHDVIRPRIFADAGFGATPRLWVLQAMLLVECFGKSRAGQKQHDMSHLFHGLLINLIRRSDCQSARPALPDWKKDKEDPASLDVDHRWEAWAEAEEKKRLALLCFMWDTQHAVLFCQSLCMSAFELRVTMPCSQTLWEAASPQEWRAVAMAKTAPGDVLFLTALKAYLVQDSENQVASSPSPPRMQLDSFARILVLHGLLSISWDMQRRDQTALGVLNPVTTAGNKPWRDLMAAAYDRWKKDFDAHCTDLAVQTGGDTNTNTNTNPQSENMRALAVFATAYNAIYHAGHILLHSEFLDVQIYAGARHILGRPVQRADFVRSERVVKRWAVDAGRERKEDQRQRALAVRATWHAACLLHDAATNLDDFDAMGLFHVPWCLYMATLTVWAFYHTRPAPTSDQDDGRSEMVWDADSEMRTLVSSIALVGAGAHHSHPVGPRNTGGLVWVMANVLSNVRWGIVHAGVVVLRGLVPSRLISQYELS